MNIRFAKEKDIRQIIKLCKEHAAFEKAEYDSRNKEELLSRHLFKSINNVKCIVVEKDDEIVGYSTFIKQFSTWDANHYIYLDCIYLKEKMRGNGIGFKLMNLIKEYANKENCHIIQWQTPTFNKSAISFYNKLGAKSKAKERFVWRI